MKISVKVAALASVVGAVAVLSGCGGSGGSADAKPLDITTVPDTLFAAGIECRNPDVSEYKVWDTPYRQLVCFGGPEGGPGDWGVNVMVLGSSDVFYGALNEHCGGKETTSSGGFPALENVAMGSNWIAYVEGTSSTDQSKTPTADALAQALGGQAIATMDDACAVAKENAA